MKISGFLILGLAIFSIAQANFTSTSFELENPIIFLEGGSSSSSSFQYLSTTGQLTQGQSTSLSFAQNAGFLYFPAEASITPATGAGGGGAPVITGLDVYCGTADFNCDSYVNLLDLSILLFYMDRIGPDISLYDLNNDGKVGLVDISIMFYYWNDAYDF